MPNYKYLKGARKERALVNSYRGLGWISFRSAGSHSPIDLCAINIETREIVFIQCKPDDFPESKKHKILEELNGLRGVFVVRFDVV